MRFALAVLVTATFYFIADGVIHGALLPRDHIAAIEGAGKRVEEKRISFLYFAAFDLGKAFVAMFVFVLARESFGGSAAVVAGAVAWLAVEVIPAIAQMPFPFYPKTFYLKLIAVELIPMIIGAFLGALTYTHRS